MLLVSTISELPLLYRTYIFSNEHYLLFSILLTVDWSCGKSAKGFWLAGHVFMRLLLPLIRR